MFLARLWRKVRDIYGNIWDPDAEKREREREEIKEAHRLLIQERERIELEQRRIEKEKQEHKDLEEARKELERERAQFRAEKVKSTLHHKHELENFKLSVKQRVRLAAFNEKEIKQPTETIPHNLYEEKWITEEEKIKYVKKAQSTREIRLDEKKAINFTNKRELERKEYLQEQERKYADDLYRLDYKRETVEARVREMRPELLRHRLMHEYKNRNRNHNYVLRYKLHGIDEKGEYHQSPARGTIIPSDNNRAIIWEGHLRALQAIEDIFDREAKQIFLEDEEYDLFSSDPYLEIKFSEITLINFFEVANNMYNRSGNFFRYWITDNKYYEVLKKFELNGIFHEQESSKCGEVNGPKITCCLYDCLKLHGFNVPFEKYSNVIMKMGGYKTTDIKKVCNKIGIIANIQLLRFDKLRKDGRQSSEMYCSHLPSASPLRIGLFKGHFFSLHKRGSPQILSALAVDFENATRPMSIEEIEKICKATQNESILSYKPLLTTGPSPLYEFASVKKGEKSPLCVPKNLSGITDKDIIIGFFDIETYVKRSIGGCLEQNIYCICLELLEIKTNKPIVIPNQLQWTFNHSKGTNVMVFYGKNAGYWFYSALKKIAQLHKKHIIIYAHYGGRFDAVKMRQYVFPQSELVINEKILSMIVCGRMIEIRDSYNILMMPIKDLSKAFNLGAESEKLKFPYELINENNINGILGGAQFLSGLGGAQFDVKKETIKYCIRDVQILKRAFMKFRDFFLDSEMLNIDLINSITLSGLAGRLTYRSGAMDNIPYFRGTLNNYIRESIVGGRCRINPTKRFWGHPDYHQIFQYTGKVITLGTYDNLFEKSLIPMDATSLYPSSMVSLEYSAGPPYMIESKEHFTEILTNKYKFVGRFEITPQIHLNFPISSIKNEEDGRTFINEKHVAIINTEVYHDLIEFQNATIKFIDGIYFKEKSTKHQQLIRDLFNERKRLKKQKNPQQLAFKGILTSAYGKMILNHNKKIEVKYFSFTRFMQYLANNPSKIKNITFIAARGSGALASGEAGSYRVRVEIMNPVNTTDCNYSMTAAEILSQSKHIMNKIFTLPCGLRGRLEDHIYYTDTDSFYIEQKYVKEYLPKELIGNDLGQFHNDINDEILICTASGCTGTSDGICNQPHILTAKPAIIIKAHFLMKKIKILDVLRTEMDNNLNEIATVPSFKGIPFQCISKDHQRQLIWQGASMTDLLKDHVENKKRVSMIPRKDGSIILREEFHRFLTAIHCSKCRLYVPAALATPADDLAGTACCPKKKISKKIIDRLNNCEKCKKLKAEHKKYHIDPEMALHQAARQG
jgi:hypothetical protein